MKNILFVLLAVSCLACNRDRAYVLRVVYFNGHIDTLTIVSDHIPSLRSGGNLKYSQQWDADLIACNVRHFTILSNSQP